MNAQPPSIEKEGILNGIVGLFQRPFPVMEDWQMRWMVNIFHGIFAIIFLTIFQPFKEIFLTNNLFINVGFGVVVSLVLTFNYFLLSKVLPFDLKKWTIGKSILWTIYDVLIVILGVFIYKNYWTNFDTFTLNELWKMAYSTLILAIIPLMIITILSENWLLRRNLKRASQLQLSVQQQQPPIIRNQEKDINPEITTLYADNKTEWIKLRLKDLIILESADNYVNIYYQEDNQVQKKLLRSTLTKINEQIDAPYIFRCHRSYIVNLNQIKQVEGNSRGLQLDLFHLSQSVPVSRKYVKAIQERLNAL